ncbi:PilZ domain-containing protein [Colwellia asteriadis]|uniref:PilZ domain-containing protein n=1 Tax=Colwellia asteriadis TaxID=517723 RepID=A0ABP3WIV7_9GAMM
MKSFNDKRNFYRMMLNREVVVTVIDDEANANIAATCRDLSATGMALEMEQPIELGTHIRIKVDSSGEQIQALDARGKVVRLEEESDNCYLLGIAIEEID